MQKQNKNFFQQSILIATMLALSWVMGFWYDFYRFASLWIFSLAFLIIIGPILAISYLRLLKNKSLGKFNLVFRVIAWLGIAVLTFPNLTNSLDNAYWTTEPGLSFVTSLWLNFKWLMISFYHLDFTILIDILTSLLKSWPYWIAAGLLYWSLRINRNLIISYENNNRQ